MRSPARQARFQLFTRPRYRRPMQLQTMDGIFTIRYKDDCPHAGYDGTYYFVPGLRDDFTKDLISLTREADYRLLLVTRLDELLKLNETHQIMFAELIKQRKPGALIDIEKFNKFIRCTQVILTYWEFVSFHYLENIHYLTSCEHPLFTDKEAALEATMTLLHTTIDALSLACKIFLDELDPQAEDRQQRLIVAKQLYFIFSSLRNSTMINKIINQYFTPSGPFSRSILTNPVFLDNLATSYFTYWTLCLPEKIDVAYFQQIAGEVLQSNFDTQEILEEIGVEFPRFSHSLLYSETHLQLAALLLRKHQFIDARMHLARHVEYLNILLCQAEEQLYFSFKNDFSIVCSKTQKDIKGQNMGHALLDPEAQINEAISRLKLLKTVSAELDGYISQLKKASPPPSIGETIAILELEKDLTGFKGKLVKATKHFAQEKRDLATCQSTARKSKAKKASSKPSTAEAVTTPTPKPTSWEPPPYPFPSNSSPSSSSRSSSSLSSSSSNSSSLSSSSEDYPRRVPKAIQDADKAMKSAEFQKNAFFKSMSEKPKATTKKDKKQDYVFEFPITPDKIIHARLNLDMDDCQKKLGETELKQVIKKLKAILERGHMTGKQGQGIKFVDGTEKRALGFDNDDLVFKIKVLGEKANEVSVYGKLIRESGLSKVVFYYMVCGKTHEKINRKTGHQSVEYRGELSLIS